MKSPLTSSFARRSAILTAMIAGGLFCLLPGWPWVPANTTVGAVESGKLPLGTVLPISLEHALSSKGLTKGEPIEGRLMQDVPLPNGEKIPLGAKLHGTILEVIPSEQGMSSITFRFGSLESRHATTPVVAALRAMAPFEDVQAAQTPYQQGTEGSPSGWATTMQIGGDMRYGSGGKVNNQHHRTIGKATSDGGVLVHLQDPPGSPCAGWPDGPERLQALWVFSGDACGLFDLNRMRIAHAGNKEPLGEITLVKEEGEIKIMKSSAMLLRVVR